MSFLSTLNLNFCAQCRSVAAHRHEEESPRDLSVSSWLTDVGATTTRVDLTGISHCSLDSEPVVVAKAEDESAQKADHLHCTLPSVSRASRASPTAAADGAFSPLPAASLLAQGSPMMHQDTAKSTRSVRNVRRTLTRKVTRTLSRIVRRSSTVFSASKDLPDTACTERVPPLLVQHLPGVTIASLRRAFESTDHCPNTKFITEVLGATRINVSSLAQCPDYAGTKVRKVSCMMPVPGDAPATLRRMLNIPESVFSTMVWRLSETGEGDCCSSKMEHLNIVQQSYTKDVLYGDRFKLQSKLSFEEEPDGVMLRQWAEVIWLKPLPWTHGMVRKFIEQRCISDVTKMAPVYSLMIKESTQAV